MLCVLSECIYIKIFFSSDVLFWGVVLDFNKYFSLGRHVLPGGLSYIRDILLSAKYGIL